MNLVWFLIGMFVGVILGMIALGFCIISEERPLTNRRGKEPFDDEEIIFIEKDDK
jgi:hypothetical protein